MKRSSKQTSLKIKKTVFHSKIQGWNENTLLLTFTNKFQFVTKGDFISIIITQTQEITNLPDI